MSTFIFDLVKSIDFLENTNFSAFSTVTRGFDILNENGTSLIPKTVVSSFCTRTKSSTSNKIILVLIKITGGVGATLVFVNIFLCVHDHCKRKRSISTHQKSLKYNSIIIWFFFQIIRGIIVISFFLMSIFKTKLVPVTAFGKSTLNLKRKEVPFLITVWF